MILYKVIIALVSVLLACIYIILRQCKPITQKWWESTLLISEGMIFYILLNIINIPIECQAGLTLYLVVKLLHQAYNGKLNDNVLPQHTQQTVYSQPGNSGINLEIVRGFQIEEVSEHSNSEQQSVPPPPRPQRTLEEKQQQNNKRISNLSFLGEFKQSHAYNQSQLNDQGSTDHRRNSFSAVASLNVVKYNDESGGIKFGVLKTLRSVQYDQLGKELDQLQHKANVDKQYTHLISQVDNEQHSAANPTIKILYESSVPISVNDSALRDKQLEFNVPGIPQTQSTPIMPKQKLNWTMIFKDIVLLLVYGILYNLSEESTIVQDGFIAFALFIRTLSIYDKLMYYGLQPHFELREIIIWIALIVAPLIGTIITIFTNYIIQTIIMITYGIIIISSLHLIKHKQQHPLVMAMYYMLLGVLTNQIVQ